MSGTWTDDSDHDEAVRKAERAERFAWRAIGGVSALLVLVAVAVAGALLVAGVALAYALTAVTD